MSYELDKKRRRWRYVCDCRDCAETTGWYEIGDSPSDEDRGWKVDGLEDVHLCSSCRVREDLIWAGF